MRAQTLHGVQEGQSSGEGGQRGLPKHGQGPVKQDARRVLPHTTLRPAPEHVSKGLLIDNAAPDRLHIQGRACGCGAVPCEPRELQVLRHGGPQALREARGGHRSPHPLQPGLSIRNKPALVLQQGGVLRLQDRPTGLQLVHAVTGAGPVVLHVLGVVCGEGHPAQGGHFQGGGGGHRALVPTPPGHVLHHVLEGTQGLRGAGVSRVPDAQGLAHGLGALEASP